MQFNPDFQDYFNGCPIEHQTLLMWAAITSPLCDEDNFARFLDTIPDCLVQFATQMHRNYIPYGINMNQPPPNLYACDDDLLEDLDNLLVHAPNNKGEIITLIWRTDVFPTRFIHNAQ